MKSPEQATLETLDGFVDSINNKRVPHPGDFSWVTPSTPLSSINMNWTERELPEKIRTKHVHRLHPYLGKYVPQLVEILLRKFNPGVVVDPFCGSGTTLVEANALGIESFGADVSSFNCLLTRVKTAEYDTRRLDFEVRNILQKVRDRVHREGVNRKLIDEEASSYLKTWFAPKALSQLLIFRSYVNDYHYSDVLRVILSRSARSSRLTTHFELDFPRKPQKGPYHCYKHRRTCKPTDDALGFLTRYGLDTVARIKEFSKLRTDAPVTVVNGDSREIQIPPFDAIVTSPPYVGLIDYHEQHRYAYELLGLSSNEELEIGAAAKGSSRRAKNAYSSGISEVFANARKSIREGGVVVIVVNDRYSLYSDMAVRAGYKVEETVTRNVNRRTGRRDSEFSEQILVWRAD